jgi:putative FmdB family regulatory protein
VAELQPFQRFAAPLEHDAVAGWQERPWRVPFVRLRRVGLLASALREAGGYPMVIYEYRCERDGLFDVPAPMGRAAPARSCPACGAPSARRYGAPMLSKAGRAPRGVVTAIERAERSRERPDVVTAIPTPGRRTPVATAQNPALQHLPRP